MKWCLTLMICISVMVNDIEYTFMCFSLQTGEIVCWEFLSIQQKDIPILFCWLIKIFWPCTIYIYTYIASSYKVYVYATELLI